MSKDMYSRTKTLTLEAYDKASDAAKKAADTVEVFVEKQMQERGMGNSGSPSASENVPNAKPTEQNEVPLAE